MSKGVLLYAHNNAEVDYSLMAIIAGGLAKKNLNVPVSVVTDEHTVNWMKESEIYDKATTIFDKIIVVSLPTDNNTRNLHDGNNAKTVPFRNGNRKSAYELTPYDQTLLIDSDFLIMSDTLSNFWDIDSDYMISESYNDIIGDRAGYLDSHVAATGVKMYWATTVMFRKSQVTQTFFDLVSYVKENYESLSAIYRYDPVQYRNDISFSIAKHIMDGFETDTDINLPPVLSSIDKDILYDVNDEKLTFLLSPKIGPEYVLGSVQGQDIHIMNKNSIIRNADKLMDLL